MNLQKKSSIWKYIFRTDAFKVFAVGAGIILHVPFCILLGKISSIIRLPAYRFIINEPIDTNDLWDLYFVGLVESFLLLVSVSVLVGIIVLLYLYIPEARCYLSVYKAARYIPLTEEELKANNIVCVNDLENFFVANVFNNIKHGCYVYEVKKELRESYSKVIAIDPDVIKLKLNDEEKYQLVWEMANDMDNWFGSGSDDNLHHFEDHLKEIQDDREDDKE